MAAPQITVPLREAVAQLRQAERAAARARDPRLVDAIGTLKDSVSLLAFGIEADQRHRDYERERADAQSPAS